MCSNANDLSDYESEGREFESLPAHQQQRTESVQSRFGSLLFTRQKKPGTFLRLGERSGLCVCPVNFYNCSLPETVDPARAGA